MAEMVRKGYVAPAPRAQAATPVVPFREGYAAPADPQQQGVPTTSRPVSAVPPPPK